MRGLFREANLLDGVSCGIQWGGGDLTSGDFHLFVALATFCPNTPGPRHTPVFSIMVWYTIPPWEYVDI